MDVIKAATLHDISESISISAHERWRTLKTGVCISTVSTDRTIESKLSVCAHLKGRSADPSHCPV